MDDDNSSSSSSSSTSDVVVEYFPWRHAIHAYYDIKKLLDRSSINGMMFAGCSSDRYLLLRHGWSDYFLHDLESMQRFSLPHAEDSENEGLWCRNAIVALTAQPNDPNCGVLYVDTGELKFVFYRLHDPRRLIYRQELSNIDGPYWFRKVHWVTTLTFQAQIYIFTHPLMRLFRVEVAASSMDLVLVTDSRPENMKATVCTEFRLVEFGDDLLLIHVISNRAASTVFDVEDFQLYKLDFEAKTWVEITHIGDNAIFLTPYSASSISTAHHLPCPIKRNSIYYLTEIIEDKTFHIFDLEDGSLTPHMPNTSDIGDHSTKLSLLNWLSSQPSKSLLVSV